MKKLIDVHAPGIDSDSLEKELKKRVENRKKNGSDEADRIKDLDFNPGPAQTMNGFDPARTTELFESSVVPPDFTSPKFRYIPRVFRRFVSRIYPFFTLLYDKLSENKIQAFYDVVHELIALDHRYRKLTLEFKNIIEDNMKLRGQLELALQKNTGFDGFDNISSRPFLSAEITELNDHVVENLRSRRSGHIICLDDTWGDLSSRLIDNQFENVTASSVDFVCSSYMQKIDGLAVRVGTAPTVLASIPDDSLDVIAIPDLGVMTGRPEYLGSMAFRKLKSGGLLFMRYITSLKNSPFEKDPSYRIELPRLREYFSSEGFQTEQENIPEQLSDGSFEIFLIRRG